jgi:hypothetical protein
VISYICTGLKSVHNGQVAHFALDKLSLEACSKVRNILLSNAAKEITSLTCENTYHQEIMKAGA